MLVSLDGRRQPSTSLYPSGAERTLPADLTVTESYYDKMLRAALAVDKNLEKAAAAEASASAGGSHDPSVEWSELDWNMSQPASQARSQGESRHMLLPTVLSFVFSEHQKFGLERVIRCNASN